MDHAERAMHSPRERVELAPVGDVPIVAYSTTGNNQSVVGVAADWSGRDADLLALEVLAYSVRTGEIGGVDVELNPGIAWSFTDPPAADGRDLQSARPIAWATCSGSRTRRIRRR